MKKLLVVEQLHRSASLFRSRQKAGSSATTDVVSPRNRVGTSDPENINFEASGPNAMTEIVVCIRGKRMVNTVYFW